MKNKIHQITVIGFTICCIGIKAGTFLDKANELYSSGRMVESIKAYKKAALNGENPALCFFNAANACYQLDSLAQAVVNYKTCLYYAPDFFKGYLNLAVVYFTLDDLGACISTLNAGLKLEPENQKAQLILATAYRKVGALSDAVIAFERLAKEYPAMEDPYIALGEMYRDLGDNDIAQKWLSAFPPSGKHIDYVYTLLSDMYEAENNLPKALYYLDAAYALDKSKRWTLYRIVTLEDQMGNGLVAYETARIGMERFKNFPELALLAGNIAFKNERYNQAELCYQTAYQLGSASAVVGLQNIKSVLSSEEK